MSVTVIIMYKLRAMIQYCILVDPESGKHTLTLFQDYYEKR